MVLIKISAEWCVGWFFFSHHQQHYLFSRSYYANKHADIYHKVMSEFKPESRDLAQQQELEKQRDQEKKQERFPRVDLNNSKEINLPIIRNACLDLGFFTIVNSSITEEDIERARQVARDFFQLPTERKSEYPLTFAGGELFGYAALGAESADVANVSLTGDDAPPDLMESFQVADVDRVENKFPLDDIYENSIGKNV